MARGRGSERGDLDTVDHVPDRYSLPLRVNEDILPYPRFGCALLPDRVE